MFYLILEFYKLKKKLALKSILNYCLGNTLFLILSSLSFTLLLFGFLNFWIIIGSLENLMIVINSFSIKKYCKLFYVLKPILGAHIKYPGFSVSLFFLICMPKRILADQIRVNNSSPYSP